MKIADLKDAPYNPRKISDEAYRGLASSIEEFGLVQPIIFNIRTQHVVGGHQRLRYLRERGIEDAQVIVVDLPEDREKALNIVLNNPRVEGVFTDDLRPLLDEIEEGLPELFEDLRLEGLERLIELDGGIFNPTDFIPGDDMIDSEKASIKVVCFRSDLEELEGELIKLKKRFDGLNFYL